MKAYRFVGLDKDVWLPDDIEVIIDIVSSARTNIRSNQRYTAQDRSIYHETGNTNPGANALGERAWLHSGAGGASVGYNFAVDDKRIIQLTPLNEVTWSAGRAEWNKRAWGIEQCVGKGLDLDRARRNAAALHGGLSEAKGWNPDVAVVQHNVVYGKNCPMIIRRENRWSAVQQSIREFAALAALARSGGSIPPVVDPPIPPLKHDLASFLFGAAKGYKFDPNGKVSALWLETGKKTGKYPRLVDVEIVGPIKYFVFSDGSVIVADGSKPVAYLTAIVAA